MHRYTQQVQFNVQFNVLLLRMCLIGSRIKVENLVLFACVRDTWNNHDFPLWHLHVVARVLQLSPANLSTEVKRGSLVSLKIEGQPESPHSSKSLRITA